MAVNLSAIKDLLLPGLRGIEGKYEMIPSQYDKINTPETGEEKVFNGGKINGHWSLLLRCPSAAWC